MDKKSEKDSIQKNENITKYINNRIDSLRPKLLDLTRRNPLLATKFSERSNSVIRFVNATPNLILSSVLAYQTTISPLPSLDEELKDENTKTFRNALSEALLNDPTYLENMANIDENSDDAARLSAKAERDLKDRIRIALNMPIRQTKKNCSFEQHARNHGINPQYELLDIDEELAKTHIRALKKLQTLLLSDMLERKLNALFFKEKTWKDETGISVLHMAFGFLEWQDTNNSLSQFSPLVLIPVQLIRKRTKEGMVFSLEVDDSEITENKILAEKLRLDFNIILPKYDKEISLDEYFKKISKQKPKNLNWKIRRWVALGVFPSARLAMYHDIASNNWSYSSHEVISNLFAGKSRDDEISVFGDEYSSDSTEIESKIPYLVTDADSSQLSAMIDVLDGKNLALEGPPGTGKSQTIANTIAIALLSGKKILFVAEKSAALEVVRSRLEAFGLGEFLLSLQANRGGKEQVIASIKERIEIEIQDEDLMLEKEIKKFKSARNKLQSYLDILAKNYANTDIKIYSIIGKSIKFSQIIEQLPNVLKNCKLPVLLNLQNADLENLLHQIKLIEEAYKVARRCNDFWRNIRVGNLDPFQIQEILQSSEEVSDCFLRSADMRERLNSYNVATTTSTNDLIKISGILNKTKKELCQEEFVFVSKIIRDDNIAQLETFLEKIKIWKENSSFLNKKLSSELDASMLERLHKLIDFIEYYNLKNLKQDYLDNILNERGNLLGNLITIQKLLESLKLITDDLTLISTDNFKKINQVLCNVSNETLSCRNRQLDSLEIQQYLISSEKKAKNLCEQKSNLEELFDLQQVGIISDYNHVILEIMNSSVFSFFNKKYRMAKKLYKLISLNKKFRKLDAIKNLKLLQSWLENCQIMKDDTVLKNILGINFEGFISDFSPYIRVIEFYKSVDKIFNFQPLKAIKDFLKFSEIHHVQTIPMVNNEHCIVKMNNTDYLQIVNNISKMQSEIKNLKKDIDKINQLKNILVDFSNIDLIEVKQILKQAEATVSTLNMIRGDKVVADLLGSYFESEQTKQEKFDDVFRLGKAIISINANIQHALLGCYHKNNIQNFDQLIKKIIELDKLADNKFKELQSITKTNQGDWELGGNYKSFSYLMHQSSQDKAGLQAYSNFFGLKSKIQSQQYQWLISQLLNTNYENISQVVEALIMRALTKGVYHDYGHDFSMYKGQNTLSNLREKIQMADREIIKIARKHVRLMLFQNAEPPNGVGFGKKSDFTELSLLRHEVTKQRQHLPIRLLTIQASKALLELKPCWMMSPLAVAQYLPQGEMKFDLVIIDEASQMCPEDAIGALVRSKQAMVVGDTNQLPPTGFFKKMVDDYDVNDDEKVTEESILEMANACFQPARRLRWHYRSKDESLIKFSNKYVYDNNLVIFPSAQNKSSNMGVSCHYVNGIYSGGTNYIEAKAMVEAIVDFMNTHNEKSLGVVLLNQKQRDLVIDEMNYALERHDFINDYIEAWEQKNDGLQSFFIKNLENVQGDERDVIFIGTVYGPESEGSKVMQRFGPINGIAGKRRLNVLFTRAKERMITYTSLKATDIHADEHSNPGVYMLKSWLEYSNTGVIERGNYTGKVPDSAFEEHVIEQIKAFGCTAVPQIGIKGYSIDIGVMHPDWPNGFIMGVECDGATYHSAKSARDRDRLRQEVLEGLGWYLYRIWSTDWFEDPVKETEKLRKCIEDRVTKLLVINEKKA